MIEKENPSTPEAPSGGKPLLSLAQLAPLQERWSISVYRGEDPFSVAPVEGDETVMLTDEIVTDIDAAFVADPFCYAIDGRTYLFFEVWNRQLDRGEIACATSLDLKTWNYEGIVLSEPFHLSYPCVFQAGDETFMIPETRGAQSARLYRSDGFPHRWRFERELLSGDFADVTPFRYQGRWWLFAHRGLDELRLYSARELGETFVEHPMSPLVAGNRRVSRPAGRLLKYQGRLFRFAQDAWPNYGTRVRVLEIDQFSESEYSEHEIAESPILEASGHGWNALGMHHLELLPQANDSWVAIVDGYTMTPFQ